MRRAVEEYTRNFLVSQGLVAEEEPGDQVEAEVARERIVRAKRG